MKLAQVYPGLYQAGQRTLMAKPVAERVRAVANAGVTMVINVCPTADPELELVVGEYVHYPFGDNSQFKEHLDELYRIASKAADRVSGGEGVLTHCAYGVNRSGFVNALIIRQLEGVSGAQALAILRKLRKGAVGGNRHFEKFLADLPAPSTTT